MDPGFPPNRGYSSENTLKQLIVFTMQTRKIVGASSGTVIRKITERRKVS